MFGLFKNKKLATEDAQARFHEVEAHYEGEVDAADYWDPDSPEDFKGGAIWFVLIYFYQKYKIKILYQKAANLYFSKGIEQAFRQLHICRKELNAKDFKSLLDEKLKNECNLD